MHELLARSEDPPEVDRRQVTSAGLKQIFSLTRFGH